MMRAAFALAAMCAACSSSDRAPRVHRVAIQGMRYVPATVSASRGDTVVWVNEDVVPHTATAPGRFDSGVIQSGSEWRHVVTGRGPIGYGCTMHPTMTATLEVR